jgi:hypothetical protein
VSGSRKLDLAALGSAHGGDGVAAVPDGLLAAVELLVDHGRCAQRPSAAAHGARWLDPTMEVVCTRLSRSVVVPGGLSAAVQRRVGWQWQCHKGNLGGPAASVAPPSPFPPSGFGGGGYVVSAAASGQWRCGMVECGGPAWKA